MEKNEIQNMNVKANLGNYALNILINNKLIKENEIPSIEMQYGYIFTKEDGNLEALYKLYNEKNTFYFALQNTKVLLININENQYEETIKFMFENHSCLRETKNETENKKIRKEKNNKYLKENNIITNENLTPQYDENNAKIKDIDEIVKKAIATLLTIQIACDINNNKYKESIEYFIPLMEKYGVKEALNEKEKRIIKGTYTMQDAADIDWEYETFWAICWCLNLVDDIKDASQICDCDKAISFITKNNSIEEFKSKCKLRSLEEILEMEDLYHRYNWAINEAKVNPNANIGNLNWEIVVERRRGLEWIISDVYDWYDLNLYA